MLWECLSLVESNQSPVDRSLENCSSSASISCNTDNIQHRAVATDACEVKVLCRCCYCFVSNDKLTVHWYTAGNVPLQCKIFIMKDMGVEFLEQHARGIGSSEEVKKFFQRRVWIVHGGRRENRIYCQMCWYIVVCAGGNSLSLLLVFFS